MAESALSILLGQVHRMIPKQLLQAAFGQGGVNGWNTTDSVDKVIKREVWTNTLRDVNLVSGKYKLIILNRAWKLPLQHEVDSNYYGMGYYTGVYRIPPHARDFGPITAVECVQNRAGYTQAANANYGNGGSYTSMGNTATGLAAASLASRTLTPYNNNPTVVRLDNETIKVSPDDMLFSSDLQLHCLVGFDQELTNMDVSLIEAIRKLFLCDVKIYIYNNLDIPINETEVTAGSDISRFKDRVMEYADQMGEREELLNNVKGAKYYDPEILQRFHNYIV